MVRKVKELVKDKGILSSSNVKHEKFLGKMTVELVKNFYYSDDISRSMPGKRDFVIIVIDGEKSQV